MKEIYLVKYAVNSKAAIFISNSLCAYYSEKSAIKEAEERMEKDKEIVSYKVEKIFLLKD